MLCDTVALPVMAYSCPICRQPVQPRKQNKSFPFCAERCRLIDLGHWLNEAYALPRPINPDTDQEHIDALMENIETQ